MGKQGISIASVFAVVALGASIAHAGDVLAPGESILDRERPELDPLGMRVRSFNLFPRVDLDTEYDSNIFAEVQDEIDDLIIKVSPSITIESDWVRHSIEVRADSTLAEYQDNDREDYEDYVVAAELTLDVSAVSRLRLSRDYEKGHEDRDSADSVRGFEPTLFDKSNVAAVFVRRLGKLSLRAAAQQTITDFEDVLGSNGYINNDDRDRNLFRYSLRAGFEFRPDIDAFLQAEVDRRDYYYKPDDEGVNRDSKEFRVAAGIQGALTGSAYAEILAGYTEREYDDKRLAANDMPWFEGRLIWSPSGLTTVTLDGLRSFDETTIDGALEVTSTRFGIRVDHELKRNLLLYVDSFFRTDKYAGIDRSDDIYGVGLGARFLVNRNFQIAIEARQRDRDSTAANKANVDFTSNSIMVSIRAHR